MTDKIPILDLRAQTAAIEAEVVDALRRVMADAAFIKGPEVKAFESEFAAYIGSPHAIGVANGTDALVLALRALDIGPGDEVITSTFTFIASAECVSLVGATPILVDIDPVTFNLDPARVEAAITPRTRAIIAVHLYGQPADMASLQRIAQARGIPLIEDCAQACGALHGGRRVGAFGDFGCFSFFPSKNLGAFGDGGMVTTRHADMADKIRWIADHGSRVRYQHDLVGTNSRLDSMQAAVLRIKLRHLETWNEQRRRVAAHYSERLAASGIVTPADAPYGPSRHVFHQYTIRVGPHRDAVRDHLAEHGVTAVVYYPISLHQQPVYAALGYADTRHPHAEKAQSEVLSLPMYPELTERQIDRISALVLEKHASARQETVQAAG